ncbi:hypothetical protein [Enhygromyxa salina]|uniref:hypothetical protein n=1 Tax=Enhygromyxa salina TaxID=215803 RepID=UPI001969E635|nr:hypothetical protein [Enhygromyxa salina]
MLTPLHATAVASQVSDHEALEGGSHTDGGVQIEYAIWRENGQLGGDVFAHDLATGDHIEMWINDDYIDFEGVVDGDPIGGTEPANILYADPSEPACLGWVALICTGVAALAAGCAFGWTACTDDSETNVPGGQGGDPGNSSGGGAGGNSGGGEGSGGGGDGED